MRLEYSRLADRDLDDIFYYSFMEHGEVQADLYLSSLRSAVNLLGDYPKLGSLYKPRKFPKLRKTAMAHHMIFYYAHVDHIWVARFIHVRADADSLLENEPFQ